jgi:hypothetical protein
VDCNAEQNVIVVNGPGSKTDMFSFDAVGSIDSTQDGVFNMVGRPICDACLEGYNGTIFA